MNLSRGSAANRELVAGSGALERRTFGERFVDGSVVRAVMNGERDVEPRSGYRALELVEHVHGVLAVRHQEPFLDDDAAEVVAPDRQAGLEPELDEGHGAPRPRLCAPSAGRRVRRR